MILKTKRLIFRPIKNEDILDVVENINNINVVKWLSVVPYPYKKKHALEWMEHHKTQWKKKPIVNYEFVIVLRLEDKTIGGCSLKKVDRFNKTAELGYWLGEKYWRQGYGSETLKALLDLGFKKLKLRRIQAYVLKGNPSSGKLLEKFNFKLEGIKRKAIKSRSQNKIYDAYIYGLLKEEYKRRKREKEVQIYKI